MELGILVRSYPATIYAILSAIIVPFICRLGAVLNLSWGQNPIFALWYKLDHSVPGSGASRSHKYNRHARADYLGGVFLLIVFGSELHHPIGNVGDSFAVDPVVEKWRSPCDHGPRVVCLNFPRGASCSRRGGASRPSLRAKLPFETSITFTEKAIHEDGREACLERYHHE